MIAVDQLSRAWQQIAQSIQELLEMPERERIASQALERLVEGMKAVNLIGGYFPGKKGKLRPLAWGTLHVSDQTADLKENQHCKCIQVQTLGMILDNIKSLTLWQKRMVRATASLSLHTTKPETVGVSPNQLQQSDTIDCPMYSTCPDQVTSGSLQSQRNMCMYYKYNSSMNSYQCDKGKLI